MKTLLALALAAVIVRPAAAADFQADWPSAAQAKAILRDAEKLKDRRVEALPVQTPKTLEERFAEAPGAMSPRAFETTWRMIEPVRDQGLTIKSGVVTPTLDFRWATDGLAGDQKAPFHLEDGDAVFSFAAERYTAEEGDPMDPERVEHVTASASYRCRLLADPRLMVCRVTLVRDHAVAESVEPLDRYEGFERFDFTPFR